MPPVKLLAFIAAMFYSQLSFAEVVPTIDQETQLKTWKILDGGLDLALVQRLPDQTRGFFLARGFSAEIANQIATQCIFQAIAKNVLSTAAADSITIALQQWRVSIEGKVQPLKQKEDWLQQWSKDQASPAAKLAFRWATFPTEQSFAPGGDYNWGMISFGLPPGSIFDLHVTWQQGEQHKDGWIHSVQCPQDR